MVIDWANASAGDRAFDVADTWVLFACGTAPLSGVDRWIVPIGRCVLLRSFLSRVDTASARRAIPAAIEHRLTDPNMSTQEQALMRRFRGRREGLMWRPGPRRKRRPVPAGREWRTRVAVGRITLVRPKHRPPRRS